MKKGFTIIEIILSISIVLIVGVSATFFALNKKSNRNLEDITKTLLDASLLYLTNEYDELGNKYIEGINKGGEGVIIPLVDLYQEGYVDKENYAEIVKYVKNDEEFLIAGYKSQEECKSGVSITAGWVEKTTYICGHVKKESNTLYSKIINQDYYTSCQYGDTSALCYLHADSSANFSDDGEDVWYFKGNIDSNYLKIEGLEDKIFRIVRTTENNNIKIIDSKTLDTEMYHQGFGTLGGISSKWRTDNKKNYISANGYNVIEYVNVFQSPDWHYLCDEKNIITNWSDPGDFQCIHESTTIPVKNPIYKFIYTPLLEEYNKIKSVLENYIDKDYKWCLSDNVDSEISNHSFKCSTEKTLQSDFGLLNIFEYEAIQYLGVKDTNSYLYSEYLTQSLYGYNLEYAPCEQDDLELAFGRNETEFEFTRIFNYHSNYWCSDYGNNSNIRPTYVIKGNSKVISGDGTEDSPYVISGFIE